MRRTRRTPEPAHVASVAGVETPPERLQPVLPRWAVQWAAGSLVVLLVAAVAWLVVTLALRLALVTFSLAFALGAVAVLAPLTRRARRLGMPPALVAVLGVVVLLGVLTGAALLVYSRASGELDDVATSLTVAIDQVRTWLVYGPLALDPARVEDLRNTVVSLVRGAAPNAVDGATMALRVITAAFFAVFAIFFLLKDGPRMWAWFLGWLPAQHHRRAEGAGRVAWSTLTGYVQGVMLVALVDAVCIGAALLVLGVPLWMSLTVLTFLGAFVPVLGATVAGAVAVLVTLVTNDLGDAVIVLVVVLVVQQLEGNVLHPLVMGRAVRIHPLAVLVAVVCGSLLFGIPGAVLAVPVMAVTYRVTAYLAGHRATG